LTDFIQRVKFNEDTWDMIQNRANDKFDNDDIVAKLSKKMKFKKQKKKTSNIPDHDKIQPQDFFNVSYCGAWIPERKITRVINRLRKGAEDQTKAIDVPKPID